MPKWKKSITVVGRNDPQRVSARSRTPSALISGEEARRDWRFWTAAGWLIVFFLFFYSFRLPNNPHVHRLDVWRELPILLLNLVDPLPADDAPPSGWRYFPQRFDLMLVAAVILAGAWGLGHLLLRAIERAFGADEGGWISNPSGGSDVGRTILSGGRTDKSVHPTAEGATDKNVHPTAEGVTDTIVRPTLDRTVFALGLGLSGLSLVTLGCGLAGWLTRPLLGGFLAVCVGVELWGRMRDWRTRRLEAYVTDRTRRLESYATKGALPQEISAASLLRVLCLVAVVPFLMAMLLGSMLPPFDFDVKEYHLQGPKEFYQNGRITFLPHNVYTSFPFLTEMLSLLAMVLRGDWYRGALAGQAVLMAFAPLTALALYAAGRRWFGPSVGLLAAMIYLTTPWTYRISIIAYAEGGLSFYLFATLLPVMIGIEKLAWQSTASDETEPAAHVGVERASGRRVVFAPFFIAGLMAGSAMACKYPGAVMVVLPLGTAACLAPFVLRRVAGSEALRRPGADAAGPSRCSDPATLSSSHRVAGSEALRRPGTEAAGILCAFAAGTLLTISPWLVKNTVETGNPVYPLLYSVFGGRDWDAELNAKWRAGHSPDHHHLSDLAVKFIDVTAKSDWLSPLLFGFAPLAFFSLRGRRIGKWLWCYVAFLFLAWWTLTHRIDRFWVPMIPVVSLLAGVGAAWRTGPPWRYVAGVLITAAVLFNLGFVTTPLCGYNAYLADLGHARHEAESTALGIAFLNEQYAGGELPPGSKVLCVGEAQVFDARFPLVYNTVFDYSIFEEWCAADQPGVPAGERPLRDPEEIRQKFRGEGITHVYVNWQEILRYRTTYGYTDFVTPRRLAQLREWGLLGDPVVPHRRDVPALRGWETLSVRDRDEIETWAPELKTTFQGKPYFITGHVFPVNP